MPIYAYKCASCGHAKDVLQKMSDAPLSTCPACGQDSFQKQLTAAGFQLKGSGWYVTDFRGDNQSGAAKKPDDKAAAAPASAPAEPAKSVEPAAAAPAASSTPATSN
ncbi:MAG: zinc ribbon domain-containing protein [Burkholderiales bacterium]|nr:MAG: zinc ribbon domain-containing protein [Burkholderiales bacterium]